MNNPYPYESENPEVVMAVRDDEGEVRGFCPKCGPPYELDFDGWEWGDSLECEECGEIWDTIQMAHDSPEGATMAGSLAGEGGGAPSEQAERIINRIVIHCSATHPNMDVSADDIRRWHMARGWSDIGYHRVIRRSGLIEHGRPDSEPGAHAKGFNSNSLAVCMVGGVSRDNDPEVNYMPEQWNALESVVAAWAGRYPNAEIVGHRDLPGVKKACPSFDVATWLAVTFGYRAG